MLKNYLKNKGGFTLTEVLVGILVLVTAIVASSNLLVSMIHSNATNMSMLQAYYYTQEGLEAFRNMRDTHFLNNVGFCGGGVDFWGGNFSDGCGSDEGRDYVVEVKKDLYDASFKSAAPWGVTVGNKGDVKFFNGENNSAEPTEFERFCTVSNYEVDVGKAFKVTCTTSWEQNSETKAVSMSTVLTDWKDE
jgi:Tfp pilus assembly protein PilV